MEVTGEGWVSLEGPAVVFGLEVFFSTTGLGEGSRSGLVGRICIFLLLHNRCHG
jgi:hypothetical protein